MGLVEKQAASVVGAQPPGARLFDDDRRTRPSRSDVAAADLVPARVAARDAVTRLRRCEIGARWADAAFGDDVGA